MAPEGDSLRFLVVDDDDDIREVLSRMVERLGHDAQQASDGAAAVEALAVDRFDYMLLDLTMPRMTGQDVLRWLQEHPQWAEGLRVIVVSARIAGEDKSSLEAMGAHAVLSKPLRSHELRDLVGSSRGAS